MKTKEYAAKILDQLIALDKAVQAAYYDMGQLLHALYEGNLHEVLGYRSFKAMIEEELTHSISTAHNYRKMYKRFKELKYNKTEAIAILTKFGVTPLNKVLPNMTQKLGARGVKRRIDALDFHQINFQLHDYELEECHDALFYMGASQSEEGRLSGTSEAFMEMVRLVNQESTKKVA